LGFVRGSIEEGESTPRQSCGESGASARTCSEMERCDGTRLYATCPVASTLSSKTKLKSPASDSAPSPSLDPPVRSERAIASTRCIRYSNASCCLPVENSGWPLPRRALNIRGATAALGGDSEAGSAPAPPGM
jgi:hypothetical protein